MKNFIHSLLTVVLSCSIVSVAHAAQKCTVEKNAYNRAQRNLSSAQSRLERLVNRTAIRADAYNVRRANLESNVGTAEANLDAAKKEAIGRGIQCIFAQSPRCIGPSGNYAMRKIGRAQAQVSSAKGRLNAYNAAYQRQRQRDLARDALQLEVVKLRAAELAAAEQKYQACLATP